MLDNLCHLQIKQVVCLHRSKIQKEHACFRPDIKDGGSSEDNRVVLATNASPENALKIFMLCAI